MFLNDSNLTFRVVKVVGIFIIGTVLAACAEPIPKAAITPVYKGQAPQKLSVGMTDRRTFILSGEKPEWFEGIFIGTYGIRSELQRPEPKSSQPFAMYLSNMLADGLRNAGTDASVVRIARGTDADTALQQTIDAHGTGAMLFEIVVSRYSIGWGSAEYNYSFDVIIADNTGEKLLKKNFGRFDTGLPLSDVYNIVDMYSAIYKARLDEILQDPEVVEALSKLAQASS